MSAWIKPTALSGRIFNKGINALNSYKGYSFIINDATNVLIQLYDGTALRQPTIAHGGIPLNAWTFLSMTYDGTTIKLYKNGAFQGQSTIASGNITQDLVDPLYIGSYRDITEVFPGSIDDVRIYNRALSAAEVANLYQSSARNYVQ